MPERWRPVLGYEGLYEVSDWGRVRSLDRTVARSGSSTKRLRGRVLRQHEVGKMSYKAVNLSQSGRVQKCLVHVLVATAFCPGRTLFRREVDHRDRNPHHNRASNLRWVTRRENVHNSAHCAPLSTT
ncbi:MAG: NUMOD4 domain-containing protein [Bacteroidota bacterium]